MNKSLLIIWFLLTAAVGRLQAIVIENDAAFHPFGDDRIIRLELSIPPGDGAFMIKVEALSDSSHQFTGVSIAENYSMFLVSPEIQFNSDYVSTQAALISTPERRSSFVTDFAINEVKYLGDWDDRPTPSGGFNRRNEIADDADNFGWMAIMRNESGLSIQNSATAIGGGIIIGSLTQIPEFSTMGLVLGAVALGVVLSRRKQRARRALEGTRLFERSASAAKWGQGPTT